MTPVIISLMLAGSFLLAIVWVKVALYPHGLAPAERQLPLLLRTVRAVGRSLLPDPLRLIDRPRAQAWASALKRMLRLAGLLAQLDAVDWLRCLAGASVLGACIAGLAMRDAMPLSVGVAMTTGGVCGVVLAQNWLRQCRAQRERALLRDLPVCLDLLALSLECGCAMTKALELAKEHLPAGPLGALLRELHHDLAAGRARSEALRRLFDANQGSVIGTTLGALVQADASGGSLAPVLRAQARQRTEERFAAAEKAALQAPVRMLLPLVSCIFPCTFIVIAFPLLNRFLAGTS